MVLKQVERTRSAGQWTFRRGDFEAFKAGGSFGIGYRRVSSTEMIRMAGTIGMIGMIKVIGMIGMIRMIGIIGMIGMIGMIKIDRVLKSISLN